MPTFPPSPIIHILNCSIRDLRHFKVIRIDSTTVEHKARYVNTNKRSTLKAWHVIVQDQSNASLGEVTSFPKIDGYREGLRTYALIYGSTLNAGLCPTEADARRVGESACQALDRWHSSFTSIIDISGDVDKGDADTTSQQEQQADDEDEATSLHEPQADDQTGADEEDGGLASSPIVRLVAKLEGLRALRHDFEFTEL